mgnify:CR=1 FL=1
MKNIIFIAPPAAGKGTQSTKLKEDYQYNHLSTGDMLREAVKSNSSVGVLVKDIIDSGKLVSDEVMLKLIKEQLNNSKGKPFILDGFPRTLNQALELDNIIDDDYEVIYLDLAREEAINRILGRVVCSCGKSYNLHNPLLMPKEEGICDSCKKSLKRRSDDTEDSFKVRFDSFLENTKPVLEYYKNKNKLHKIDVNRDVSDIYTDILRVVNDKY